MSENWNPACPLPDSPMSDRITLAHGDGGRLTRRLIEHNILTAFDNPFLNHLSDAAILPQTTGPLAFTTDSFVVSPLLFPGGDIGTLAVYGTVNDLVVSGAIPRWISLSLIIEEGLPIRLLERVLDSIATAAEATRVQVVTGDTKVVPKGAADQLFINTAGIGEIIPPAPVGPRGLNDGHEILVSGPIGRHGLAILASRENLGFIDPPHSDCAPLTAIPELLRSEKIPLIAMRDATRGGVTAVLHEWAAASRSTIVIDETAIPVSPDVRGGCELLGLEPLHLPNEGTMLLAVPAGWGSKAIGLMQRLKISEQARQIGTVTAQQSTPVLIRRRLGTLQPLDEPAGGLLPRIC